MNSTERIVWRKAGKGWRLFAGKRRCGDVVPDSKNPGMWRAWCDGRLSDMANLSRAKDAVACFAETEGRKRRGRHSQLEARLCVKTNPPSEVASVNF